MLIIDAIARKQSKGALTEACTFSFFGCFANTRLRSTSSNIVTAKGIHTLRNATPKASPAHVMTLFTKAGNYQNHVDLVKITPEVQLFWAASKGISRAIDACNSCNYIGTKGQEENPAALASATASVSVMQIRSIARARPLCWSISTSVPLSRTSLEATSKGVGVKCRVV